MARVMVSHKRIKTFARRSLCLLLAVCFAALSVTGGVLINESTAYAAKDPMIKLTACKKLAVSASDALESLDIQVETKQAAMQSAVKALREKERNMSTVRWSPLLSIKFPVKPNEEEAFTFQFKPKQLQYQINILKHKQIDQKLKIYENVSNIYIKIITAQQAIKYDSDRYEKLGETVEKLKAKQKEGSVKQEQVDKAQAKYESLETTLANDKTDFERGKEKLSEAIGKDVSTGYRFEDAFVTADMSRDFIPLLQQEAVEKDQAVYEAEIAQEEALLALRVNYSLMSNKYGHYMNIINTYIEQAFNGEKIPKKAFRNAYNEFVKRIDENWQGHYKFWFIKIPKEWLKGDLDGVRYIEDDPYVLYTAALEYETARKECENTKKELRSAVKEGYDSFAEARKGYIKLNDQYTRAMRRLSASQVKNLLGELSDEEFKAEEEEVESLKGELNDALSTYSETLYSYDRTCCGAVSKYLTGSSTGSTDSGLNSVIQKGITYTIRSIVETQEFLLTINVPSDYEAKTGLHVTRFALYSDGRQIGDVTDVGKALRHMTLTMQDVGRVTIRVYDGSTFLDEGEIDPTVYIGELNFVKQQESEEDKRVIGTYTLGDDLSTEQVTFTFKFNQDRIREEYVSGEEAATYNISTATGTFLLSDAKIKVDEPFHYLAFIKGDVADLVLHLYDSSGNEIGVANFDAANKKLRHEVSDEEAAKIAKQKQEEEKKAEEVKAKKEAEDKAKKKRDEAVKILGRLGFEATDQNVDFTVLHLRELAYVADLSESNAAMDKKRAEAEKTYEKGRKEGAGEQELEALQKRITTYKATRDKQQETIDGLETFSELKRMNGR